MNTRKPLVPSATQPDAAVLDLGSNSFHLLLAQWQESGWRPVSQVAEKVQLAAELGEGGAIETAALVRAEHTLRRFAPHLRALPAGRVAVVGTQALRMAANRRELLSLAERLLGHSVTVLSGAEEARLVFAASALERTVAGDAEKHPDERLLVVDVGGASTELATGCGHQVEEAVSVPVGCLTWRRYFGEGELDEAAFQRAYAAACELFAMPTRGGSEDAHGVDCASALSQQCWRRSDERRVVGCSGTLQALEQVLISQGWSSAGIDRAALAKLQQALLRFDHIDAVAFDGLTESRRSIFAAGAALVIALFDTLGIDQMQISSRSLRHALMDRLWAQHHRHQPALDPTCEVA